MIKGKTATGFDYEIEDQILDDYEIVEMLGDLEDNPLVMPKLITKILGKDQLAKLREHLRGKNGVVSTTAMAKELESIFMNQAKAKK